MRRSRSTLSWWSAVVALALLAVATTPHVHDEAEGRGDTCVLCHVQGSPLIASTVHDRPDLAAGGRPRPCGQGQAPAAEIEGHASRAPPA